MTARVSPPHSVLQTPMTVMITDAYVAPEQRRAGIGRDLFEVVIEWAPTEAPNRSRLAHWRWTVVQLPSGDRSDSGIGG